MTENKKAINDVIKVTISNIIKLVSGILVGFLLPKIIGVADYGYYKTFTLYATYVGLFHFGINDGILLHFGGKNLEELNKKRFRCYLMILLIFELSISIIISIFSFTLLEGEYRFILFCISFYLVFNNLTGYYQYISQATSRFSELSFRNIIQSFCISLGVIACAIVFKFFDTFITYRTYTIIYVSIYGILMIWYIYSYRSFSFGERIRIKEGLKDIKLFINLGIPLMIANLCSSLILSLDRQFVNVLFDTKQYAVYAFAYNMLSLVTTATSAVAAVLYPNLKRMDSKLLSKNYNKLIQVILIIVYGGLLIYFPLFMFVKWFLPQYSASLPIFRIIFPGLAVSSAVTIIMHNYYKTIGKNKLFFVKSLIILAVSCVANYLAYVFWGTTESISWASIVTMLIWYLICEFYFVKRYSIFWIKHLVYMILMMIIFYCATYIENIIVAFIVYLIGYGVVSFSFFKKFIRDCFLKINM